MPRRSREILWMDGADGSPEEENPRGLRQKGKDAHQECGSMQDRQGDERRIMSEIESTPRTYSGALLAAIAVAVLCAIGGLVWTYTLSGRLAHEEAAVADVT